MRKLAAALLGCLALAGCASDWQAEATYKVTKVYDYKMSASSDPVKKVQLELVGSAPSDVLAKNSLSPQTVTLSDIGGGSVDVGDQVTCTAKQHSRGATQTNPVQTELSGCRKA